MGINRIFLLGNLGSDPELRYTTSQNPVCSFRLATNERRKNAEGEWVDHTEWHRVVVWGKTAENCAQYLSKGRQAFIEGRVQTRKWQDQEGKDRYTTEVVASNVQFVGGRGESAGISSGIEMEQGAPEEGSQPAPMATSTPKTSEVAFTDDDIPF